MNVAAQKVDTFAFKPGEKLIYRVYYSSAIIDATAGEAILEISEDSLLLPEKKHPKKVFKLSGTGFSKGLFDFFFPVRDTFESYVDQQTLLPYHFMRATHEGNYQRHDQVWFDRDRLKARTSRKKLEIPANLHDMLSALYFMRLADVKDFDADSMYTIYFYLDDSVYHSAIKYLGRDTVKTKLGRIPTLKIAPMMATGEVFAKKYPMFVWVSDDKNHVPVLASSEVIVGSVKMELISYKNIKYPFVKPVTKRKKRKHPQY